MTDEKLEVGMVLRHKSGGEVTLSYRKEDDTGWWNTDGSGLSDRAVESDDWEVGAPESFGGEPT